MDYEDAAHHLHVKLARPPCAKRLIQKRPRLRMAGPSLGRMRPPCGAQSDNSGSDVRDGCRTAAAYMDTWRNSGAVAIRILPALFMTLKRSRSAAGLGRTTLQSPLLFCQRCPRGCRPIDTSWTAPTAPSQ